MSPISELTRIDRSVEIRAPRERVWRALTDPAELSAWFQVKIEGDIAPGQVVWMITTHPDHEGKRFRVWFIEMTPPARFVWQWHPGAVDPGLDYSKEPKTTVTFTLDAIPSGTRLSVAETGFDDISLARRAAVYKDNSQGWTEVLVWVRKHVEAAG